MNKTLPLVLLLLLSAGSVLADKVPQDKALLVASAFFRNSGRAQHQVAVLRTSEDLPGLGTKGHAEEPCFYIIGNGSGNGFVIISGDDRFSPILGYSLENSFTEKTVPENVENWFLFLREQMTWAQEKGITASEAWKNPMSAGKTAKLLKTPEWSQGDPYNGQCPMDGTERCKTGCIATAICEVMRYHKWPLTGKGMTEAYTKWGIYVGSRNLDHTYDWDNMPFSDPEFETAEQKNAVAVLMADVGAAFRLNYSSAGTSGRSTADKALYLNFGYSPDAIYDKRDYYKDSEWESVLKSEINSDRPVIYCGSGEDGGHAFVIDGYDVNGYFHVNWGWSGECNGYYSLSAFKPEDGDGTVRYDFTSGQNALIGFRPGDGTDADPNRWIELAGNGLECSTTSFPKDADFKIEGFQYTNTSFKDFNGQIGLAVTDKAGNIIETLYSSTESINVGFTQGRADIKARITSGIKPGYRIRAFYKSAAEWIPMWRENASSSITQEILIAEDTPETLEEMCSMSISHDAVTVTFPAGAEAAVYDGTAEVTAGVTMTGTSISVAKSRMDERTYRFRIAYRNETKEINYKEEK